MAFLMKVILPLLVAAGSAMARPQNFDLDLSGTSVTAEEPFDPNPSYTYSYQVAADEEQTYIAHQESRDSSVVTGEYSYVDPLGTLITVRYTADDDGYREERSEQPNFIQVRARPVVAKAPVVAAAPVQTIVQQAKPIIQTAVANNKGNSDSDLVAKIIAQLTPFIKTTVSSSLGGSAAAPAAPAPVRNVPRIIQTVVAKPAAVAVSADPGIEDAVAATFGTGGNNNVVFETPDFGFAYDLEK